MEGRSGSNHLLITMYSSVKHRAEPTRGCANFKFEHRIHPYPVVVQTMLYASRLLLRVHQHVQKYGEVKCD